MGGCFIKTLFSCLLKLRGRPLAWLGETKKARDEKKELEHKKRASM